MSSVDNQQRERIEDLVCESVTCGLDTSAAGELRRSLSEYNGRNGSEAIDLASFERAAAAVALAEVEVDGGLDDLPEHVARDLRLSARTFVASTRDEDVLATISPADAPIRERKSGERVAAAAMSEQRALQREGSIPMLAWGGWLAAAACLLVAFVVATPERAPTLTDRLASLQVAAGDVISASWLGIDDADLAESAHPNDEALGGEIVWSDDRNEGYMVLTGLTENDPDEFQYQLWIFDAERRTGDLPQFGLPNMDILTQRPVDGGVFDFEPGEDGSVIVPVDPKIKVGKAAVFAVTKEKPGGVVVSDRDIVFLALAGQG